MGSAERNNNLISISNKYQIVKIFIGYINDFLKKGYKEI